MGAGVDMTKVGVADTAVSSHEPVAFLYEEEVRFIEENDFEEILDRDSRCFLFRPSEPAASFRM